MMQLRLRKSLLMSYLLALLLFTASGTFVFGQNCFGGWAHSTRIGLNNAGSSLSGFQVKLTLNTAALVSAGQMQASGADMRFVDGASCCTQLCHYVESGMNTASTVVWVKVPSVPSGASHINLLHGNPAATDVQSAPCTFELYDDFAGNALNTSIWQVRGTPSNMTVAGGFLTFGGNNNWEYIRSLTTWTTPVVANFIYWQQPGAVSTGPVTGFAGTDNRYSHRIQSTLIGTTFDSDVSGGNVWADQLYPNTPPATAAFQEFEYVASINSSNQIVYTSFCNKTQANCNNVPKTFTDATGTGFYVGFTSYSGSYTGYLDRVIVRKYANPEPTSTTGATQAYQLGGLTLVDTVSFCAGSTAVIDAGPGFASYGWSNGASTQTTTVGSPGWIGITVADSAGCTIEDSALVVQLAPALVEIGQNDTSVCDPFSLVLDAGAGYASYLWSTGATTQSITTTTAGTFEVTITDANGCEAEDSVVISVLILAPPSIVATPALPACEGTPVVLDAGQGYASYNWGTASTQTLTVTQSGIYSVTVTNASGCEAVDTLTASFWPLPVPQVYQTIGGGGVATDPIYVSYQWLLNGNPISGANSDMYQTAVTGNYSVTVVDSNGCEGTSQATFVVGVAAGIGMQGFEVYPNPNQGSFVVKAQVAALETTATMEVFAVDGRKVYHAVVPVFNGSIRFEAASALPVAGVYMLRLHVGDQTFAAQVVRQ